MEKITDIQPLTKLTKLNIFTLGIVILQMSKRRISKRLFLILESLLINSLVELGGQNNHCENVAPITAVKQVACIARDYDLAKASSA